MRLLTLAVLSAVLAPAVLAPAVHRNTPATVVRPNPNTERAGVLRNGVLTVILQAKASLWYLNGPNRPPMTIAAFAEAGKPPLMPGPLMRAPAGTELRFSVHNGLSKPLTFFVPATVARGASASSALDSVVIAPGATGLLSTKATLPGNYAYRATIPPGRGTRRSISGLLGGALVIDTAGAPARARDRVFVIMEAADSAFVTCADTATANIFAECLANNLVPPAICGICMSDRSRCKHDQRPVVAEDRAHSCDRRRLAALARDQRVGGRPSDAPPWLLLSRRYVRRAAGCGPGPSGHPVRWL